MIEDLGTLLKLGKMVHFINLPADRDIISQKVMRSRNSFRAVAEGTAALAADFDDPESAGKQAGRGLGDVIGESELFMFVLADTENPGCLGTSQLISCMGGPSNPNVCFKLGRREMFSPGLQTGTSHTVAKLHLDSTAPTEIGGLILQPSYRGHPQRLGRFISLVRFHFIGLHRAVFRDEILAEMMAQITPDGHNLFWDFLGRRFIPLSYTEADRLCQYSREFMMSLLPREEIYLSLLPPEPRAGVGQVGVETIPARRLLEKLGFAYKGYIDPFDGGPYLHATTDEVPLVAATRSATLGEPVPESRCKSSGIVSTLHEDGDFYAVDQPFLVDGNRRVRVTREAMATLHAQPGDRVGLTDTGAPAAKPRPTRRKAAAPSGGGKKSTAKKSTRSRAGKKSAAPASRRKESS
jgi:arginine N-succinyltransferase